MAKGLFKLLLLGALAAGASGLPGLLGGLPSLAKGEAPDAVMPQGDGESSRELRREFADLGQTMADLKALTGPAAPKAAAGLSREERELLKDAAPKIRFKNNSLTRQLGLARGGPAGGGALPGKAGRVLGALRSAKGPEFQSFGDFRDDLLRVYRGNQAAMAYVLWAVPAGLLALAFLLLLFKRYTLSMLLTGWVFLAANLLLWSLSAAVLLSSFTKQGLLAALPGELWLSPVAFLVASVGLLRLADENYPFWNRTVSTLFTPIAASCAAAFWPLGFGWLKGLLAGGAASAS